MDALLWAIGIIALIFLLFLILYLLFTALKVLAVLVEILPFFILPFILFVGFFIGIKLGGLLGGIVIVVSVFGSISFLVCGSGIQDKWQATATYNKIMDILEKLTLGDL